VFRAADGWVRRSACNVGAPPGTEP